MDARKVTIAALAGTVLGGLLAVAVRTPGYAGERDVDRVVGLLRGLTLEEKVGQMFMFGFPHTDPAAASAVVTKYHAGGVILFKHNIVGNKQLKGLTGGLQRKAKADTGIPLLVSTDEEGGQVQRLADVVGHRLKSNAEWGKLYATDKAAARNGVAAQAKATAGDFIEYGLNMNLAPVLDVVTVKDNEVIGARGRSYGTDPGTVSDLGVSYIRALRGAGVAATAKHFPGHGPTKVDSHLDKPEVRLSSEELMKVHAAPFKAAVDAGVDAVMTAHITYRAVDPDNPSTMSRKWITDILRGDMGFKGVVITDGMLMGAVGKGYTVERSVLGCVKAGADILLFDHGVDAQGKAYNALLDAVRKKAIPESRIDESVLRILSLKAGLGLL